MTKSYRLRTQINSKNPADQVLRVNVEQDFDFLEVLSMKLTQSDVYRRFCSDYGVIAGRVVANGGFGIPNARVSVFVPISDVDLGNPVISTLYPYRNVTDRNEDGYRYNLLPYEPSYVGHVPTGTFPTKQDILSRTEVLEIYENYYKYTVKTNESGDYMIVGAPLGDREIVVDIDLSDMGCFSLRPSDLIRMNRAVKQQFDNNNFRSSTDIDTLPQIVNLRRSVNVGSFWGQDNLCNIGITRVDFDLRDQDINIEPTALFMGSIFTSNDSDFLKNNCKPKPEQGDLCGLTTGPGTLLAVRQTVNLDPQGRPILEQYPLPAGGKVIDENGAWVVELPMNLDYLITDEYGNLVVSMDPKVGIPSKSKYRFKVKYDTQEKDIASLPQATNFINANTLNLSVFTPKGNVLRGSFLLPNIKEYGWRGGVDPSTKENEFQGQNTIPVTLENNLLIEQVYSFFTAPNTAYRIDSITDFNSIRVEINGVVNNSKWIEVPQSEFPAGTNIRITVLKNTEIIDVNNVAVEQPKPVKLVLKKFDYDYVLFQKSYSFSLDWDDYVNYQDAVNCEDIFYEFIYNKIYTTAQLIDEYRNGRNRSRFLAIKEILERNCQTEVTKFPVNDGQRNFDLLFFVIQIFLNILSFFASPIIFLYSIVKFLWNDFFIPLSIFFFALAYFNIKEGVQLIAYAFAPPFTLGDAIIGIARVVFWAAFITYFTIRWKKLRQFNFPPIRLPMITYPDCSACDCGSFSISELPPTGEFNTSFLADVNSPSLYAPYSFDASTVDSALSIGYGQVVAGREDKDDDETTSQARTPRFEFQEYEYWNATAGEEEDIERSKAKTPPDTTYGLPIPERINLYNTKGHYFKNVDNGGTNRIKVFLNYLENGGKTDYTNAVFYEDQPLVVLCDPTFLDNYSAGTVVSFVAPSISKDVNVSATTENKNALNTSNVTGTTLPVGTTKVTITYANPNRMGAGGTNIDKSFNINQTIYTSGVTSYGFPADIEYYQVVTGFTYSEITKFVDSLQSSKLPNSEYERSFYRRILKGEMCVGWGTRDDDSDRYISYTCMAGRVNNKPDIIFPLEQINGDYKNNMVVAIFMKGVDPYSQRHTTKIDISKIFGLKDNTLVAESNYKLNIPIRNYNSLGLEDYSSYTTNNNINNQLFYPSYYFTPSVQTVTDKEWRYTAFTTSNHLLYSSFSTSNPQQGINNTLGNSLITGPDGYFNQEYIEGAGFMRREDLNVSVGQNGKGKNGKDRNVGDTKYTRSVYNPTATTITMSTITNIVMRSDRLPRSSSFDNNFVLAQNKSMAIYPIPDTGYVDVELSSISNRNDFSLGLNVDFAEEYGESTTDALSTFSCDKMVPLGAYTQTDGQTLSTKPTTDRVYFQGSSNYKKLQNGCYVMGQGSLTVASDQATFFEWKSRFLVSLATCRNVFGLTFVNQWVNGGLYMPAFQNEKIFLGTLNVNEPTYKYCKDKLVFRIENNSFFYRSSPYDISSGFVGMQSTVPTRGNKFFIGNPTTITDLGPKDNIIKNICSTPNFLGYVGNKLQPTSFQPIDDLLQLFVISRLSNAKILEQIFSAGDASINVYFPRRSDKISGDFAQMASINSEFGVVPFTPENYTGNTVFYNSSVKPNVGVFYSGSTADRDAISPGREIFIDTINKFGYNKYGKKTQNVPMYKWQKILDNSPGKNTIFGSGINDWYTKESAFDLFDSYRYQDIDRLRDDTYYPSPIKNPTTQRPGYIYATSIVRDSNNVATGYTYDAFNYGPNSDGQKFLVGAPYHFYFGLKIGKTALDKFIRDYAIQV